MGFSVLHLIGSFEQGGSEHQALQLARLQNESGRARVSVACFDRTGPLLQQAEHLCDGDLPAYPLTGFYNRQALRQLLRFAHLLREREIDILHTHDFYTNVFGMAAGALARVPVRIASRRETFGFRMAMQKRVERSAYHLAHAVVANSEAVKRQLIAEGVHPNKITTIYNGLDLRRVTPAIPVRREQALAFLGLPCDVNRRFVTLVANMRHPVKDHPTFLRAAQRVQEVLPQASFIIAGEGELTEQLRVLAGELGLKANNFFIGRCERIAELLAISEVCVLSSTAEGFSNSILEYMAAARPVVATDVGGAREAIVEGETGYLVPAGDDQKMAKKILSLLTNPDRARAMGEAGRVVVQEKFSCENQLERTQVLYDKLWKTSRRERKADSSEVKTPLRVLIAAPSLNILGGQSRQAVRLITGLSTERSLRIGFLPHDPRLPRGLSWLQRIKYVRTLVTTLLYWAQLLVRVPRYDIVHIFSASYYSYLLSAAPAILVARLYRKTCILNYRSGEAEDHLQNWRASGIPIMRLADVIVVPSGYLVDVFAQFGLKARAIYNLVELDRFHYRERRPIRPVFLTSRLLEPLYNVACVLRAFALIQQSYPEAQLTVAADGWLRDDLERLSQELNLRSTKFVGRVPFEQMPATYDAADIYLTATNIDNMPASITECMASGLPVVTTDAGGVPYIVTHEETCLMVPRDDYQAMAAAALRLLEDNELAVGIARRARGASQSFTWNAVRNEWIRLYHELVENKGENSVLREPEWERVTRATTDAVSSEQDILGR